MKAEMSLRTPGPSCNHDKPQLRVKRLIGGREVYEFMCADCVKKLPDTDADVRPAIRTAR